MPNISRSKGNQTMKLGLLIEYKIKNIFLEKSYTNYDGENSPRPFAKNQNSAYLWINSLVLQSLFLLCVKLRTIEKKAVDHLLLHLIYKR